MRDKVKIKVICYDNAKKSKSFDNELKAQQYFDYLTIRYNHDCKIVVYKNKPAVTEQLKIEI